MGAELAGPIGQHGAAQQWRSGVVATAGIANHPLVVPPASVAWLALGLHLQRHAGELVLTVAQLVAMAALQNQKAATSTLKPAAWMGHITDVIYL